MHVTQRINGAHRIRLPFNLFLVKLHFVGQQTAVALLNIHIAAKHGIIRIIAFSAVCINGNGLAVRVPFDQRTVVARNAKHTL